MAKRIMNKWRGYTVADCDCKYCLYYGGRKNREVNCLADECVCKAELQEAARRERKENGSKNQQRDSELYRVNVLWTVLQTVRFFFAGCWCCYRAVPVSYTHLYTMEISL